MSPICFWGHREQPFTHAFPAQELSLGHSRKSTPPPPYQLQPAFFPGQNLHFEVLNTPLPCEASLLRPQGQWTQRAHNDKSNPCATRLRGGTPTMPTMGAPGSSLHAKHTPPNPSTPAGLGTLTRSRLTPSRLRVVGACWLQLLLPGLRQDEISGWERSQTAEDRRLCGPRLEPSHSRPHSPPHQFTLDMKMHSFVHLKSKLRLIPHPST